MWWHKQRQADRPSTKSGKQCEHIQRTFRPVNNEAAITEPVQQRDMNKSVHTCCQGSELTKGQEMFQRDDNKVL